MENEHTMATRRTLNKGAEILQLDIPASKSMCMRFFVGQQQKQQQSGN